MVAVRDMTLWRGQEEDKTRREDAAAAWRSEIKFGRPYQIQGAWKWGLQGSSTG